MAALCHPDTRLPPLYRLRWIGSATSDGVLQHGGHLLYVMACLPVGQTGWASTRLSRRPCTLRCRVWHLSHSSIFYGYRPAPHTPSNANGLACGTQSLSCLV